MEGEFPGETGVAPHPQVVETSYVAQVHTAALNSSCSRLCDFGQVASPVQLQFPHLPLHRPHGIVKGK